MSLEDVIHMSVCQSIGIDFDDIEEHEREVAAMLREYILTEVIGEDEYVNMIALAGDDLQGTKAFATFERNELRAAQRREVSDVCDHEWVATCKKCRAVKGEEA